MHKEVITYTDYNGNNRTETFWFNLSAAEAMEFECSVNGGITEYMKTLVDKQDVPSIFAIFKKMILMSYGEKSNDGRRFIKSPELSKEFSETEAYSQLFTKLTRDNKAAAKFMNGIVPEEARKEAKRLGLNTGEEAETEDKPEITVI